MKIGVALICHNDYEHFERCALSLHNQTWPDWHGYVVDVDSSDHIEKLTFPFNRVQHCGILKERFHYLPVFEENKDGFGSWDQALKHILGSSPTVQIVGFARGSVRFNYTTLVTIYDAFKNGAEVVYVEASSYPRGSHSLWLPFMRRHILEHFPPKLYQPKRRDAVGLQLNWPKEIKIQRVGAMGLAESFHV